MRVSVDTTKCAGHMLCSLAAPEVFGFDDNSGKATVLTDVVPEHLEESARKAERDCPERAIVLTREAE